MDVKMCVAGEHGDGKDLFYCIVSGTKQEYNEGLFYVAAKNYIESTFDIEAEFVCDENDPCGKFMMTGFQWNSLNGTTKVKVEDYNWE